MQIEQLKTPVSQDNGCTKLPMPSTVGVVSIAMLTITLAVVIAANLRLGQHPISLGNVRLTVDGMLAFQLGGSIESTKRLIQSWSDTQKAIAGFSLGFDYLLILSFSICLYRGCRWANEVIFVPHSPLLWFGRILALGQIVAGVCDGVEDVALLMQLFGEPESQLSVLAFRCAVTKFLLIIAGVIFIGAGVVGWIVVRSRMPSPHSNPTVSLPPPPEWTEPRFGKSKR